MHPLPPQAYTKDTLVKAYQWIQLQPKGIQELATTPDVLVSLFLKAKLQGESALDRPSIQNFKSELKNLAGQLGEFESAREQAREQARETIREPARDSHRDTNRETNREATSAKEFAAFREQSPAKDFSVYKEPLATERQPPIVGAPPSAQGPSTSSLADLTLDAKSKMLLEEIRSLSNLPSENEALRLVIAVGCQQLKNLLR